MMLCLLLLRVDADCVFSRCKLLAVRRRSSFQTRSWKTLEAWEDWAVVREVSLTARNNKIEDLGSLDHWIIETLSAHRLALYCTYTHPCRYPIYTGTDIHPVEPDQTPPMQELEHEENRGQLGHIHVL